MSVYLYQMHYLSKKLYVFFFYILVVLASGRTGSGWVEPNFFLYGIKKIGSTQSVILVYRVRVANTIF